MPLMCPRRLQIINGVSASSPLSRRTEPLLLLAFHTQFFEGGVTQHVKITSLTSVRNALQDVETPFSRYTTVDPERPALLDEGEIRHGAPTACSEPVSVRRISVYWVMKTVCPSPGTICVIQFGRCCSRNSHMNGGLPTGKTVVLTTQGSTRTPSASRVLRERGVSVSTVLIWERGESPRLQSSGGSDCQRRGLSEALGRATHHAKAVGSSR